MRAETRRARGARVLVVGLVAVALTGLGVGATPSAPVAAATNATIVNTDNAAWLQNQATSSHSLTSRTGQFTFVVRHAAGETPDLANIDLNGDGDYADAADGFDEDNLAVSVTSLGAGLSGVGAVTGDVYSLVTATGAIVDPGSGCSDRQRTRTIKARVRMSSGAGDFTGEVTGFHTQTSEGSCVGSEDYAHVRRRTGVVAAPFTPGQSLLLDVGCTDRDSGEGCDDLFYRWRSVATGELHAVDTYLDIDDSEDGTNRYNVNVPLRRGRWILESRLCDSNTIASCKMEGDANQQVYSYLATVTVDDSADPLTPSLSVSDNRPDVGSDVTLTAGDLVDGTGSGSPVPDPAAWSGWTAECFDNRDFTNFKGSFTQAAGSFTSNFGGGRPTNCGLTDSNTFSIRYTATVTATHFGSFGVTIGKDDDSEVFTTKPGGVKTSCFGKKTNNTYHSGSCSVAPGVNTVTFEWADNSSDALASFVATLNSNAETDQGIQVVDFDTATTPSTSSDGTYDQRYVSTGGPAESYRGFPSNQRTHVVSTAGLAPGVYTSRARSCDNGITICGDSSGSAASGEARFRVSAPPTVGGQTVAAPRGQTTAFTVAIADTDETASPLGGQTSYTSSTSGGALTGGGGTYTCAAPTNASGTDGSATMACSITLASGIATGTRAGFTYTITDDDGATSTPATVTVDVQNTTPTATAQTVDAAAGAATAITLAGTDVNGDPLTCATTGAPAKGGLAGSGCARTYTSNPGEGGADSFGFTVSDGTATSSPATVSIAIANPDLSLAKTHSGRFNEGTGTGTYTLTVANTSNAPANGTTTLTDTLPVGMVYRSSSVGSSGFTCAGTPGVSTTVTCTRTAAVAEGASLSLTITVDVAAGASSPLTNQAVVSSPYELAATTANNTASDPTDVNHRPTAADVSASTAVDAPVLVTLAGSDPDGDSLTFTVVAGPSDGAVFGSGATRQYVPNSGFQGVDSFTYTVTDTGSPGLTSATHTVTVYVGVARLTGVVTDEVSGQPIAGVEARLVDMADPQAGVLKATVVTNASGAYDFGPVAFGTYGVRFVDPSNDHISEWFDDAPTSATANLFTLDDSTPVVTRSVALRPGGRITGTVRSSAVPNPVIAGLQVRLVKVGSAGSQAKTTDGAGHYGFELLQPGSYQVWFRDLAGDGWVSEWYSGSAAQATSTVIEVAVGQQVAIDELIDPVAPPPPPDSGSVSGTVTDAVTGAPLAGVQVRLYRDPYTGSAAATTDANGQYTFTRLAPAAYRLWFRDMSGTRVSEYGGDASTLAEAETLTLANDGHVVDAALAPRQVAPPANSGVISGSVLEVDGFTPIVGLQVRLYPVGGTGSRATTTGADGSYAFTGLAPGSYQVWFRDLGRTWFSEWHLDAATQAGSTTVTAANGQTADIDATLNRR